MKYYRMLFFCALFLPGLTFATVRINEVAWMGTAASQYSEWIELYNDAATAVSLKDWKLYKTDNVLLYTLSKTIPGNGYLLVERTTATAPDAVSGINDEAGTFGGSGLRNNGEDLTLIDTEGVIIDKISFATGWPAGDAKTKETMQWSGTAWITALGTPDAANATKNVVTIDGATQSAQTPVAVPATVGGNQSTTSSNNTVTTNQTDDVADTAVFGEGDKNIILSSESNNSSDSSQISSNNTAKSNNANASSNVTISKKAVAGTATAQNDLKDKVDTNSSNNSSKTAAGTKQVSPSAKPAKRTKSVVATLSSSDLSINDASANTLQDSVQTTSAEGYGALKENNHSKIIIIAAVAFCILALFLLLARFKAQKE